MTEKLRNAIKKYLDSDTDRKKSAAKGLITKAAGEVGSLEQIWEVLREFPELPDWMHQRFTRGSQYLESDRLFGWYADDQVQAESLPLAVFSHEQESCLRVNFYGFRGEIHLWKERGFEEPEPIPFVYYSNPDSIWVNFSIAKSALMARYGYALPCELQWRRSQDELLVIRSIFPHGFWQAWKWWEGAQWWYLQHRPELFADSELWEVKPKRWEPENNPYAAVLGGILGGEK